VRSYAGGKEIFVRFARFLPHTHCVADCTCGAFISLSSASLRFAFGKRLFFSIFEKVSRQAYMEYI